MRAVFPNKRSYLRNTWISQHFARSWLTAYGQGNVRRQIEGITMKKFGFQGQRIPFLVTIAEKMSVQIADIIPGGNSLVLKI
jgi:hypothetical protein